MTLTDHIEKIVKSVENSHLASTKLKALEFHFQPLKTFLNCTREQSLLFSLIFYQTLESGNADFNDLARHLEIPVMRLLKYKPDIDFLVKRRLVRQETRIGFFQKMGISFFVPSNVIDGLLKNRNSFNTGKLNDSFDFVARVVELMNASKENAGGFEILKEDFTELCSENNNLYISTILRGTDIPPEQVFIMIFAVYKMMNGEEDTSLSEACEFLEGQKSFQLSVRRSFINKSNTLIKRGFLELTPGMFRHDTDLRITEKGLEYLFGNEAEKFIIQSEKTKDEIHPEKIPLIKLWFNAEESRLLKNLEEILEFENFERIVQTMKAKNMKPGFTILLYGSPGTGKTESVYQLARITGRSILPVDISQSKSMWFGESEKQIKGIFEKYKMMTSKSKVCPIMLFNEADGIFGKRTTSINSPVSQTLNAMQNIILQEMEDFEGIMIATTNLTENLDNAFDRRFLYKVKFETPKLETRIQIMHDKLPFLTPEAIGQLCGHFSLTGGQMANIAKKCSIHELLNGTLPGFAAIEQFCKEERGLTDKKKLGF